MNCFGRCFFGSYVCVLTLDCAGNVRVTFAGEKDYTHAAKTYDFQKDLGARYAVTQCWKLSRQDYKYYVMGVGFTILGTLG